MDQYLTFPCLTVVLIVRHGNNRYWPIVSGVSRKKKAAEENPVEKNNGINYRIRSKKLIEKLSDQSLKKTFNSFMADVTITYKPVNWFAEQINWLVSIETFVMKKLMTKRFKYRGRKTSAFWPIAIINSLDLLPRNLLPQLFLPLV